MAPANPPCVLHYLGYDHDRGGIMSVVRALASTGRFECQLGMHPDYLMSGAGNLPLVRLPALPGERINLRTFWSARRVARTAHSWLHDDSRRIFHGHSRAGLLVAYWLVRHGATRVAVSVHCYGRQKWFYRWCARQLGGRLYWLSPAMRRYYGLPDHGWAHCIPGCVPWNCTTTSKTPTAPIMRLGGIGALVPWKGWHLILTALTQLPSDLRAQLQFTHIGAPEATPAGARYAAALMHRTAEAGLSNQVHWLGQQPSSAPLLARIDALVVASHQEPFSIAMLEALSAGVPLIAADTGGATDLVQPPVNGWLFRSGDPAALARTLTAIAQPQSEPARIEPTMLARFNATHVAEQWLHVYQRLRQSTTTAA